MKFIPKTNEKYKFTSEGRVYSLKQNRFLKLQEQYTVDFEHGRRNISTRALQNMYWYLENESKFKTIPFATNYSISNEGFVYSHITNCEVQMFDDKDGYKRTSLVCNDGVRRKFRRCRLVCLMYVENPDNKPHVNHINSNKFDDYFENLEWVTPSENTLHGIKYGNIKRTRDKLGRFI